MRDPMSSNKTEPMTAALASGFDRFVYSRSLENERSPRRLSWLRDRWSVLQPKIPMETPMLNIVQGRPHAMAFLPAELRDAMVSCDNPFVVKGEVSACLKCVKCQATSKIREFLAIGVEPDIIFDWYLRKMAVGPYIGSRCGDPQFRAGHNLRPWVEYPEESK